MTSEPRPVEGGHAAVRRELRARAPDSAGEPRPTSPWLNELEAEAIEILREGVAAAARPPARS